MFDLLEWLGVLADCDGHPWDCGCAMCSSEAFPGVYLGTVEDPSVVAQSWPTAGGGFETKGNSMLVLSRRNGESLIIGTGDKKIVVTLVAIRDGKVRIGIDAAKDVPIHRKEIHDIIMKERQGT